MGGLTFRCSMSRHWRVFFVIKSLEAMYHVYLYEIQEVDFKLKYGGAFLWLRILVIFTTSIPLLAYRSLKKTNVIYKKFLLYVEFPLLSTSCYFKV